MRESRHQISHQTSSSAHRTQTDRSQSNVTRGRRWHVIQTQPNKEQLAFANLRHQGFQIFYPRVLKSVSHARRRKQVLRPLFPGYMFALFDKEQTQWRRILGTYGVSAMIMEGHLPKPVPRGVIETLSVQVEDKSFVTSVLVEGQQVEIINGPFARKIANVNKMLSHDRVALLLEIMGSNRNITIRSDNLLPFTI